MIDTFLSYLRHERNYSEKTIINYGTDIKQFKEFVEKKGEFNVAAIKAGTVREWMMSLMENNYATVSVNCKLSSLRAFYEYHLKQGTVTVNPMSKIIGPKNKKPLPLFLRESEMNTLLDETQYEEGYTGSRDRLIIEIFYLTGIRLSELVGLDDVHVDFSASVIKVTGKRNKQRLIPFADELKKEMLEYINVRNEAFPDKSEAFFIGKTGRRISKSLVGNIVKKHLTKVVTLKKKSPHVLRHTFATAMLNNEAELVAVKELLGHSGLATTEIYTHTTFEELKKIYKQAHPRV